MIGQAHELRHIGPGIRIDHLEQKLPHSVGGAIWQVHCGTLKAFGLQTGQADREVMAFSGGEQKPLAPVEGAGALLDEILVDQLFQDTAEALLGDAQNIEKVRDLDAGIAIDKMENPVMGTSEIVLCEHVVRVGGEVAIGEKEQFNQIVRQLVRRLCRTVKVDLLILGVRPGPAGF